MFIVFLKFSENKSQAGQFMEAHNQWIAQGFDDGVFLLAGTLQPKAGGAIIASSTTLEKLEKRMGEDPFVINRVVTAQINEVTPGKVDDRLSFLGVSSQ